jgi:ABC-2 type transport system ATP-binding protein
LKIENVIEVNELTKRFGDFVAVDHITFTVKKGEIFGFLGPNGAGKSTTIKMLITILNPTSGSAKVCGHDVVNEREAVRSCIGIVFQDRSSDRYLTGRENLDFHARMYDIGSKERKNKIDKVLDLLELKDKQNIPLHNMPEGLRRRFEVARGFMTSPDVVFLDEPTIGFDIKARMDLWKQIRKAKNEEGSTVLLTTHYIEEADYLCDRVAIIDQANIIAIDTPKNLKASVGEDLISLQTADGEDKEARFIQKLKATDWVKSVDESHNSILLNVKRGDGRVIDIIDLADNLGVKITSIDEHEPSLEDVFVHFTGGTIREAEGGVKDMKMKRGMRGG